jgi:hypothetical protein
MVLLPLNYVEIAGAITALPRGKVERIETSACFSRLFAVGLDPPSILIEHKNPLPPVLLADAIDDARMVAARKFWGHDT